MHSAIFWLRRDLRLADQPALHEALSRGYRPIPVYIHDVQSARPAAAGDWWLHHSLLALRKDLQRLGSDLIFLKGESTPVLLDIARQTGARAVFWNLHSEPEGMAQDAQTGRALTAAGLEVQTFATALLRDPRDFGKADNSPYRVFTPFWKALQKTGPPRTPLPPPGALPPLPRNPPAGLALQALDLLPKIKWYGGFSGRWQPGESAAWSRLQDFLDNGVLDYSEDRDRPALHGTSRLSPHLHFGEITAAQVWHLAHTWAAKETTAGAIAAVEAFLRQIAWREFAHHLLFHFPHTTDKPLDARYSAFPWAGEYSDVLARWQKGETGIPVVDAGMRELWSTGWMHNRVRMISASLLTKNLLVPWQHGAQWFDHTLVDADVANNSFGWQWTAGCGADAAPYFRIFNPVTQGERFDPDGSYVRRWAPELQRLPAKWIHKPWQAPAAILGSAGVTPGGNYPEPVVDLAHSRKRALAAWDRVKQHDA